MRMRLAAGFAIAVHAAATVALWRLPERGALVPKPAEQAFDVAIVEEEERAPAPAPALAHAPALLAAHGPAHAHDGVVPQPPTPAPESKSTWSFNPLAQSGVDATSHKLVGGGLVNLGALKKDDAPLPAPNAPSKTGGLTEALDERDVKLGLSRGGPVLAALEDVARSGDTPMRGNATFDVTIDAEGRVAVSLADASEGSDLWARQIGAMRDAVGKKQIRLPRGSRGIRLVIRLESKVQYADGRDPRNDGPKVDAKGLKIKETKNQIIFEEIPA